jgi:predicted RNase H-like HicB family nuclease
MKKSFTVVVERDPESNWLVGEVVELPGCYTEAPDLPTLEANIREAIQVYLETKQARNLCQTASAPGGSR